MIYNINVKKDKSNIFKIENIIDQETGEVITLEQLLSLSGTIFVSNLNIAFFEIIKKLKNLKFRNVYNATKKNQFSFAYKNGECYSIRLYRDKLLIISNFEKKFLREFGDYETNKKLVDYSIFKNRNSSSIGRDAFNEWLQSVFKCKNHTININACMNIFRQDYPVIKNDFLETAKTYTSGYQIAKRGYYHNVYNYDIISSFPSQLLNDTPVGLPREFDSFDNMPTSYWYIVKFTALDIVCKDNCIDFLECNNSNIHTFVLTKHLFELFKTTYTFKILKIKRIQAFKTRHDRFIDFVYNNVIAGKLNEFDPIISKYNKGVANSIVGYFGKNTTRISCKFIGNTIHYKNEECEPIYLPLYLFVTGKAKAEFIRTINRIGLDNIIYANTDGILTSNPVKLERLNYGRVGQIGIFKQKPIFKEIYIDCINGYSAITEDGKIDNTISGMKPLSPVSVADYMNNTFDYVINEITTQGVQEHVIHR